jgi:hypothetical protein
MEWERDNMSTSASRGGRATEERSRLRKSKNKKEDATMAGEGTGEGKETGGGTGQDQKPAWIAQLPDDLKGNETFTPFKTLGDFGKAHLETAGKVKDLEGKAAKTADLEAKLAKSIPKLADDSTDEEKEVFWHSLGMPEKPEEYELPDPADGEKDPIMDKWARTTFHKAHLSKEQATLMGTEWNQFTVAYNAAIAKQEQEALAEEMKTMKAEMGDKYDANVEMGKRFFKKVMEVDFNDKTPVNTATLLKFVIKAGRLMGEDTSPSGAGGGKGDNKPGLTYSKSPKD